MKEELAERLLARIMAWDVARDAGQVAAEQRFLRDFSACKYDEYEQFSPGMRFIESLALWLQQFKSPEERRVAYQFVKERLLFVSRAEMEHLVRTAYPDVIRPILLRRAAERLSMPEYRVRQVVEDPAFSVLRRRSLFLGLSDGANTGVFRRSTVELSHEQVYLTYELSVERVHDMLAELRQDLKRLLSREPTEEEAQFEMVFLIDDFAGSGTTCLRKEEHAYKGKFQRFADQLSALDDQRVRVVNLETAQLHLVFYILTAQAREHLNGLLGEFWGPGRPRPALHSVYPLRDDVPLSQGGDEEFLRLCQDERYYDGDALEDRHTKVGGGSVKEGFGGCRLPLVLSHNSPNDSVALLWSYENARFRGLFPRVPRHRE